MELRMKDSGQAENFKMLYEYSEAQFSKQIERLEYQQWQEEYRRLVFAKELKLPDNAKTVISRRAKRRHRQNKVK